MKVAKAATVVGIALRRLRAAGVRTATNNFEEVERVAEPSAHDVARHIRALVPGCGVLRLHKLLYYCQGWHLAWTGKPLFDEKIEAWTKGPVVASLWGDEKSDRPQPQRRELEADSLATVQYVVQRYGRVSGEELIRSTHQEAPWREASECDDPFQPANPEITHDAMQKFFQADKQYRAHRAEVRRLRERKDIYAFAPLVVTPELESAVSRFLGEGARHDRLG